MTASAKLIGELIEWNKLHPTGTIVDVELEDGSLLRTETQSDAWITPEEQPVVKIRGLAGCVDLWRVLPVVFEQLLEED